MSKLKVSKRADSVIASPIRKFLPLMLAAEKKGVGIFKLNVGDPDLELPKAFLKTIKSYSQKNLGYAPSPGIAEHSKAWQKYYKQFGVNLDVSNIIPTVGCAEAIMLAMQAVADYGDEIIVFQPLYTSYKGFAAMTGVKLVPITLKAEENFELKSIKQVEKKITRRTKAIVVINPDNPTGKLWSSKELKMILALVKKHKLFLISDETYREIRFSGRPVCLLKEREYRQHVIVTDSVSKRFSMPGARIGCVASFNKDVIGAVLKFAQARLSAPSLEQLGTVPLLSNSKPYVSKITKEYKKRKNVVYNALKKMPGVVFSNPQGAFYQAVTLPVKDAEDFVKFMLTEFSYKGKTVMITPMEDFYITPGKGRNEIRIAYVLNTGALKQAMEVLKRGLEAYLRTRKQSTVLK